MSTRTLTKSRYKLGCECPTKLYYTRKKEYADQKLDDSFLQALADGGYQVGELAKYYMPGGTEVKTLDSAQALRETAELLKQEEVVIYEAALAFENLFVRVDILKKSGGRIELYEVKSKTFDPTDQSIFWTKKKGGLLSNWRPYLEDVAFQKYVAMKSMPGVPVLAYLMLVDKTAVCAVDGLNQKFMMKKDAQGRKGIQVSPSLRAADLKGPKLIQPINVDGECAFLYEEEPEAGALGFEAKVKLFSDSYAQDKKIPPVISKACGDCEFTATPEETAQGLKNGRIECWKPLLKGWSDAEIMGPTVLDIWNYRGKDKLIVDNRLRLSEVRQDDFNMKSKAPGLSSTERQWLQVEKAQKEDSSIYFDHEGMAAEMATWKFPLHFIDFETSMAALPFHKGRRPYEGIAFQFSHHTIDAAGKVAHKTQYLNTSQGTFPNYDFVRALKKALSGDNGTIFRYASHENTYLNHIHRQLESDPSVTDRAELQAFIESITKNTEDSVREWQGSRAMVDMLELVKKYFFAPQSNGSNSIKYVLPAILQASEFLRAKYSKPVYGAEGGIPSLNFKDMAWVRADGSELADPYSLLPPVFHDIDQKVVDLFGEEGEELMEGGAAMAAYGRLQYEAMEKAEREAIHIALLKYCELDTLAMVMIFEAWREWGRTN
jgi:hypothetical protein